MENTNLVRIPIFNWKTFLKIVLSLFIASAFFYLLSKYISFEDIAERIRIIPFWIFLISCFLLLFNYFFRALRIHLLLSKRIPLFHLYLITIIHNTCVQLLPFRLGEFSFLYLTTKTKKVETIDASLALITARFFDVGIVLFTFLFSFLFLDDKISFQLPKLFFLAVLFSIVILGIFFFFSKKLHQQLTAYSEKQIGKKNILLQFLKKIENIFSFLNSFHSKKILFLLFFYSFCLWGSYSFLIYFLYLYVGLTMGFMNFLFVASGALLFALIPLQGIAGFGNVEISWSALLMLFGIEGVVALKTTVLVHIIGIISTIFLGILGVLFLISIHQKEKHL